MERSLPFRSMKYASIHVDAATLARLKRVKDTTGKTYTGVISSLLRHYLQMAPSEQAKVMFTDQVPSSISSSAGSPPG